jgi:hypothetical protein
MAFLHILLNFILIACLLCLPLLMVSLTYDASTKSRFNKLTVFSTGMLCAPLLVYMWIYRDTLGSTQPLALEQTTSLHSTLNPIAQNVEDLKFSDFFVLPIGPHGLEITRRLSALDGKRVRIKGYMVQQELAKPGYFLLTALPTKTTEADDSMADDLPPSTLFVHVHSHAGQIISHRPGLLEFTGFLSVGPKEESDTRVSSVRLMLDSAASHAIIAAN